MANPDEIQKRDFAKTDIFAPMTEDEVKNFKLEMLPKNSAKSADKVSLKEAVESVSNNFEHLFG